MKKYNILLCFILFTVVISCKKKEITPCIYEFEVLKSIEIILEPQDRGFVT
jgi:hypothetical protein